MIIANTIFNPFKTLQTHRVQNVILLNPYIISFLVIKNAQKFIYAALIGIVYLFYVLKQSRWQPSVRHYSLEAILALRKPSTRYSSPSH